uniref:Response regulator n=1 Tax=candidate division WOR-3 bacterium TaxID=2052148 RepID=A0A7C6AG08_UNCW3
MNKMQKILVVDDEITVCKSITSALEDLDYTVDMALSGEEAVNKHNQNQYHLIIADLMMPDITGIELLKKIKAVSPDTQFILVTGYPSIKTAVEAIKLGAFDYIPKPFTPDELRSVVNRAIQSRTSKLSEKITAIPKDYYCIIDNAWAKIEPDGNVKIGAHEFLVKSIGSITMLEFPRPGEMRYQGEVCVRILTDNNRIYRVWTPVSGKVLSINEELRRDYTRLLTDPYKDGWMVLLKPTNLEVDLKNLTKC